MRLIERVKTEGFLTPLVMRLGKWLTPRGKVLSLLLIGLFVYLSLALATSGMLWESMSDWTGGHTDLEVYRERGEAILNGQIPYKDFYSESPPLIVYFFAPAQLAGGSVLAYGIEFGLLAIGSAMAVYMLMRKTNPLSAYLAAIFILCSPALLITSVILVQDEVIVLLFYLLPLLLLLRGLRDQSALALVMGALTKVYSAFLAPILLILDRSWRERARHILIMVVVVSLLAIPFALADLDAFLSFPSYYFDTWRAQPTTGVSLWHFLYQLGINVPTEALLVAMIGSLVLTYVLAWRKKLDPLRAGFMLFLPFLLFFPKVHEPYYLIPAAFMAIFGARQERYLWMGVLVFILPLVISGFSTPVGGEINIYGLEGGWIAVPILITLGVYAILIHTAWMQYRQGSAPIIPVETDAQTWDRQGE